jgi:hypothetical protein
LQNNHFIPRVQRKKRIGVPPLNTNITPLKKHKNSDSSSHSGSSAERQDFAQQKQTTKGGLKDYEAQKDCSDITVNVFIFSK